MSKVRLTGATSGFTELTAPAVAGSNTITLPSGNGSANQLLKNGATAGSLEFASDVVIDSSGRLLVGTSTAVAVNSLTAGLELHSLATTNGASASIARFGNDSSVGPQLNLGKSRSGTLSPGGVVQSDDYLGAISFCGDDGTDINTSGAAIVCQVDGTPGANDMPGRLMFYTTADGASTSTERMRIRSDGNVGIAAPGASNIRLIVVGSDTTNANLALYVQSTTNALFYCRNDGGINTGLAALSPYNLTTGVAANVVVDAAGFLYRSTSSARFKTDIETLEDSYADALLDVRPVWYRSIAPGDTTHPDWGYWGFIAEEVAEIDPRLVFWKTHETQKDEDNNDIQVELEEPLAEGVQYDRFVPHLLNLIKRQSEQIEALTARVTALEAN